MKKIAVLYQEEKLKKRFSKSIVSSVQDIIVSAGCNSVFMDIQEDKKEEARKYIHKEFRDHTLLIVGGDRTFEFYKKESPVDDGDGFIFTDNWWASSSNDIILPEISVSRFPESDDDTQESFLSALEYSMKISTANAEEKFGVTASIWRRSAESVFKHHKGMGEILISPPFFEDGKLKFKKYKGGIYCNLHGGKDISGWYGQRSAISDYKEEYPLACAPSDFSKGITDSFLFSEACFGGFTSGKKTSDSIMLTALRSGFVFVIGSTATAYGGFAPPLSEADLLASLFYDEFFKGKCAGDAFLSAKKLFCRKSIEKMGFLDDDDKKTLISFVFYGNPFAEVNCEN